MIIPDAIAHYAHARKIEPDSAATSFYQELEANRSMPLAQKARAHMEKVNRAVIIYHTVDHQLDVDEHVMQLMYMARAHGEPLSEKEERNLFLAAEYHDTGFSNPNWETGEIQQGHEDRSVQLFLDDLEQLPSQERGEFDNDDVAMIVQAIQATKLISDGHTLVHPKTPFRIARMLQDADVSNFGRDTFSANNERVFQELQKSKAYQASLASQEPMTTPRTSLEARRDFLLFTRDNLLGPHAFTTPEARILWMQKEDNIAWINKQLAAIAVEATVSQEAHSSTGSSRRVVE